MKLRTLASYASIAALIAFGGQTAKALSVSATTNADTLVNTILGSGITYTPGTAVLVSTSNSAGTFTGGAASGLGIDTGILLTSGTVGNAVGPNNQSDAGTDNGTAGTAALNALIPGYTTHDATTLTFNFSSAGGSLYFNYVFGSEEYNEWVGSSYNDVFGFFLDGVNIALLPGTTTPVSINNVNNGANSSYYVDNTSGANNVQYDGFTKVLTTGSLSLSAGTHTISLQIADAGDGVLDSGVFIQGGSFSDQPTGVPDGGATVALLGLGLIGAVALRRRLA